MDFFQSSDFQWYINSIPVFLLTFWKYFYGLLPYLIAGVLVSELLKITSWTKIIYRWVSKSPFIAVVASSIVGIVSPLCTYGSVPIVMELYKSGVHIAPLVAFLAASSMMNPQLFIMISGGITNIGFQLAVVLTICIFIICIALGFLMYLVPAKFIIRKNIKVIEDGGCYVLNREKKMFIFRQFLINSLKSIKNIGVYMLIGIFLAVVIDLYIPKFWIYDLLGEGKRVRSIIFGALLGVPLFACGGGAVPLVNRLVQNGMGKGTGLAFFIVGSATRPAPLAAMATMFTPLFLVMYCVFLVISSVLLGILYF